MPKLAKADRRDAQRANRHYKPRQTKTPPVRKLDRWRAAQKILYDARQTFDEQSISIAVRHALRQAVQVKRKASQLELVCLICGRSLPGKSHWNRCKPDRELDARVSREVFGERDNWQLATVSWYEERLGWTQKEIPYYSTNLQAAKLVVDYIQKKFGTDLSKIKDARTICVTALSLVQFLQ